LDSVAAHPSDLARLVSEKFQISRQATNQHLNHLVAENVLTETGKTRRKAYSLKVQLEWSHQYRIIPDLAEDRVWTEDVSKILGEKPENVLAIWHYGLTEIFNNALEHSGGKVITIFITKTAIETQMVIMDDGIGIFKKIQVALNLSDERHAILELAKGKLTTDPDHHTGEGIFFTSRMMDSFDIISGGVIFSHEFGQAEDWIIERKQFENGTSVWLKLSDSTTRTLTEIFDQFSSENEFGFSKTVVPVRLAQYGNDKLISRSQAKRLLARIELFRTVIFDFSDVVYIGQAFADEIFRVFAQSHPQTELVAVKTNSEVQRMIDRARNVRLPNPEPSADEK
jgi:anti-sigma regulatory factor (Ser/Thr protein kinase)